MNMHGESHEKWVAEEGGNCNYLLSICNIGVINAVICFSASSFVKN